MPKLSVPANAEGLSKFSRRSVLFGAAAVSVSSAILPVASEAATLVVADTKILKLMREYKRLTDAAEVHHCVTEDADEELEQLFFLQRDQVEDELLATPCTCAGDFAAKIIVATCRGDMFPDWESDHIWIEARQLSGWEMD